MKNKLIILLTILSVLFTACASTENDNSKAANTTKVETAENTNPISDASTSQQTDLDSEFDAIVKKAEESAKGSNKIESGEIYDNIKSIYDDIVLTETASDSLMISINVPYTTPDDVIKNLFDIVNEICTNCALEDKYNSLGFVLKDTNGFKAMFNLTSYKGFADFTSTEPTLINSDEYSDYEESLHSIYVERYSSNDLSISFDNALDSLADEYGVERD